MTRSLLLLSLLFTATFFISCNPEEDDILQEDIAVIQIKNLKAFTVNSEPGKKAAGDYIKFSFSKQKVVNDNQWDIALRTTEILVNGGEAFADDQPERTGNAAAYITDGTMASVVSVDMERFLSDSKSKPSIPPGSGNGWYLYDKDSHIISPIAGKIIVLRTHDNQYVKMEILSYYKDAPSIAKVNQQTPYRYYTFNYVYLNENKIN